MDRELERLIRTYAIAPEALPELLAWAAGRSGGASTLATPSAWPEEDEEAPDDARPSLADRYEDLGLLGQGAMGEVRRVRDRTLERTLAMKIVRPDLLRRPQALARFALEARAQAQLQHPAIVPVHDFGRLSDGRAWFTMKEVRGRTLREVIAEVHQGSQDRWEEGTSGWTLRRLLGAFASVCSAVAYAHERGVVHRDLKPENVMVGTHGEVYVVDWGLAKIVGAAEPEDPHADAWPSEGSSATATRFGQVTGTPAYMPPEQAAGDVDRVGPASDVYALGAVLYEILSGRRPFPGSGREALDKVLAGPPPPVGRGSGGPTVPEELVAACERAMAREPAARFPSAQALAEAALDWLDGVGRRERALALTALAADRAAAADELARRASEASRASQEALRGMPRWAPEEAKAAAWRLEDEADAARLEARLKQVEADEALQGALQVAPDLPEAHAALVERYLARHARAESTRDVQGAAEAEILVQNHARALPHDHPTRGRAVARLAGRGSLTLVTDPPGAEVLLYRYVEQNRRSVEVFERSLGAAPVTEVPMEMGRWLCVLRHPDAEEVRYPVEIPREGRWDGVPPGGSASSPVALPPRGSLGHDDVYVPAGWFLAGGDPEVSSSEASRVWCPALVVKRHPVTNREYLAFLDDLVARGFEEAALRHAPRERASSEGQLGALIYGYEGGRFSLRPDAEGDVWDAEWPVVQVDALGAEAYAAWLSERTGHAWRLPHELEWEKAARGVDGRWYPWGDPFDASRTCMADAHPGPRLPVRVDALRFDVSPYGVVGMAGNAQTWCADTPDMSRAAAPEAVPAPVPADSSAYRSVRGGAWDLDSRGARCAARRGMGPLLRSTRLGLRLVRYA